MGYFGTSGPQSNFGHSIGAGYARRANQLAARHNSPLGNIGNIAGNAQKRLSDAYDNRFVPKYGDPYILKKAADDYSRYLENNYTGIKELRDKLKGEKAKLESDIRESDKLRIELAIETSKDPIDTDVARVNDLTRQIRNLLGSTFDPAKNTYNGSIHKSLVDKDKELTEVEKRFTASEKKLDEEFIGELEDYFVEGGLVHERKAAALSVGGVVLGLAFAGVIYYGFLQSSPKKRLTKKRLISGNKSAAMAVFG